MRGAEHRAADATDQRGARLAGLQRPAGMVQGNQGGRAGGIDRERWAMQIKNIGKTVGSNAQRVTCHRMR